MHDTVHLENLGVPAIAVATDEFRNAARAQAAALGRAGFEAIYVPHPIQDQTREEIEARAEAAFDAIAAALTGQSVG